MHPLIQLKRATLPFLIVLSFVWLGLLPKTYAVSPAPDGGYPGGNTAEGQAALLSLTTGGFNTAVGFLSLRSNTTGQFNTAVGAGTLLANSADLNAATGAGALFSNTTGSNNTADGALALFSNTTGGSNTANGFEALFSNTTGIRNTANGDDTLAVNTTGSNNTANGTLALFSNTTGNDNTANGDGALQSNTDGTSNVAIGREALFNNTDGGANVGIGRGVLSGNTTGSGNTAIGYSALINNTTGGGNIALGNFAGQNVSTASNVISIGPISANVSNTTYIANIYGTSTLSGTTLPVIVSDGGQLGTTPSSRRFKQDIRPMDKASETILAFKPVTFHYKTDKMNTPQFGLIAEEVAEVNPNLVVRDKNGEIYTVRYDAVDAMLLNEFLKEHGTVQELKKEVAALTATVKEQASQIQKVSAQLETSKPAPQTVLNDP